MNSFRAYLLASAAFANRGSQAMADYKQTPDPKPLLEAVAELAARDRDDITKRAADMAAMVDYWDKTDAIVEGEKAVRDAASTYLPRFYEEEDGQYNARLKLTKFTNVYRDIVEGLASKPFEEEISILGDSVPEQVEAFCEDVDGDGNNLTQFASLTFFNGINSAIDWILIDYPVVDTTAVRTQRDQKQLGIRPYWSHVLGRNVLEVRTTKINGKQEITFARIFEPGVTERDAVRIFERVGNVVTWQLWIESEADQTGKRKFVMDKTGVLSIGVIPLVPFATGRRDGKTWKFFPAMQDAADLQIQLYQDESALKFAKTLTGYPMLAANGFNPEMMPDGKTPKKVRVGPNVVLWGRPDGHGNHGTWSYVEPSAQSLTFLAADIKETKQDLRELGRQPLTATSGNLTVITTAVAAGKARSAVSAWALGLKDALENALKITCIWMSVPVEPEVNVYNEFDSFTDGGADLTELGNARRAGDISLETYWLELKRRKVLSPEFDGEEEKVKMLAEMPSDPDLEADDDITNPATQPGNAA